MERDEAIKLINEYVKTETLFKHMLATEAIMKEIAKQLGENVDSWGLTGLLHDIDYEFTQANPAQHCLEAEKILAGKVNENIRKAIKAHNFENLGLTPATKLEIGLIAADAISGLIIACALVMPSKKLKDVKPKTIKTKFKDKSFARSSSRERIVFCEKLGIPKEKFFELALSALQKISDKLGL